MSRLARLVAPGLPHHVTQRGNGRAQVFFSNDDYALYRALLTESCQLAGIEVWAWVLMPNHVHLILVPSDPAAMRRLRQAETIGRPLGGDAFLGELETLSHRSLKPAKRGPKLKSQTNAGKRVTLI